MEMDACRITHAASAACAQRIASALCIRFLIYSLLEFISYLYPLIKIYSPIPTIAKKIFRDFTLIILDYQETYTLPR